MSKSKAQWVARFRQEAQQHLVAFEVQWQKLAQTEVANQTLTDESEAQLRELFRLVHTIKGSAAMVGQTETAKIAEQLELIIGTAIVEKRYLSESQKDTARNLVTQIQQKLA